MTCPVCGRLAISWVQGSFSVAHPERGPKYPRTPHCATQHRTAKWAHALNLDQRTARDLAGDVRLHVRDLAAAAGLY
ncbi:MAG: hypothetical protein QOK25_287 [Thermoleophilaceae bacterium]|nr:hypothetical protein [Thermoleophilaceae bacterium]